MKDTSDAMEQRYREMLMSRSGEERVLMAFAMFDFARAIMRGSLEKQFPDPVELKTQMFLRMYGQDFPAEQLEKIVAWLRRVSRKQEVVSTRR
jgi:hypothetical protein